MLGNALLRIFLTKMPSSSGTTRDTLTQKSHRLITGIDAVIEIIAGAFEVASPEIV